MKLYTDINFDILKNMYMKLIYFLVAHILFLSSLICAKINNYKYKSSA